MQLSTAIPTVIAAIVIVIISNGMSIQPIKPKITIAAKRLGMRPMIATVTDRNSSIMVNKIPAITNPRVRICDVKRL